MKRRVFLSKGTAGVIALGAVGCSNDNTSNTLTSAFKTSISGNILDSDGNGIQGVNIVITGNEMTQSVSTNETGKFSIEITKNGEYTLYPVKTGYTFKPMTQKIVVNNSKSIVVNILAITLSTYSGGIITKELGTTGIMVSNFALGSHVDSKNTGYVREYMVREAFDRGVTVYDVYSGEYEMMGKYLAPVKNEVVISVPISPSNPENDLENILNYFGRDCIDMVRCHARNREGLHDDDHGKEWWMWEELFKFKEQGKVRAVGVPIHFPDEIDELIATYPIDFVIFPFNFYHNIGWPPDEIPEDFIPFAQTLREKEIGMITMKPFAGDYFIKTLKSTAADINPDLSFTQSALKYIINSGLEPDTTFTGMNLFEEFIENIQAYYEPVISDDEITLLDEVKTVAEKSAHTVLPDHYRFLDKWASKPACNRELRST